MQDAPMEKLWPEKPPHWDPTIDQPEPSLTVHPGNGLDTPAVLVCPGGAYRMKANHEGEPVARWLNSLGITAFVLDYRVAPYRHPVPFLDGRRALRMVRARAKEWGLRTNRIGVLGFSAGGHLAATLSTRADAGETHARDPIEQESSRPDFAVLCYPVISLALDKRAGSVVNLLGDNSDIVHRNALSAERNVTSRTPPTFLWHTADDGNVPAEHSLLYAKALAAAGVEWELHVFPEGGHGLGLAEDDPVVCAWTGLCAAWLRKEVRT
jgi:acetyl esterase/lipase